MRLAEASRISGDAVTLQQTLEDLDVTVIRAELGLEFGTGLIREKILQMNSFPEELHDIDTRQVLDGLGKIWERGVELNEANQKFIVYETKSFEIDHKYLFDPAIELELKPPLVIHSDSKNECQVMLIDVFFTVLKEHLSAYANPNNRLPIVHYNLVKNRFKPESSRGSPKGTKITNTRKNKAILTQ